jgi:dihydroorotate dehydrogenase
MGFNNVGVERFVENVKRSGYRGILGYQPREELRHAERAQRADDYVIGLRAVYPVRELPDDQTFPSPNTKGLRAICNPRMRWGRCSRSCSRSVRRWADPARAQDSSHPSRSRPT